MSDTDYTPETYMTKTGITVVIVTWNSAAVLSKCVSSILADPECNVDLIVVDNNSTDPSYVQNLLSIEDVRIVLNQDNQGYARAVNAGLSLAKYEWCAVLNPDIIVPSGTFSRLVKSLAENPELGAIAPLLHDVAGNPQIEGYYQKLPSPLQSLFVQTSFSHTLLFRNIARRFFHSRPSGNGLSIVDQIPGAFMVFHRSLFQGSSWLNPAYFIWMEDVDFCLRVKKLGRKIGVLCDLHATHIGGTSFAMRSTNWKRKAFMESLITYVALNCTKSQGLAILSIQLLDSHYRTLRNALKIRADLKSRFEMRKIESKIRTLIWSQAASIAKR